MKRLIVNADDFGLTAGVNDAICDLHAAGVVRSATLMTNAPATRSAIAGAFVRPSLGVGCHIVLVDGVPLSPPERIPSLLAPEGDRLRPSLVRFALAAVRGRLSPEEIEIESEAQIRAAQQSGLGVTHLDTHKHTHMFPAVLRPLLNAARRCGIGAIRNPFEPEWSLRASRASGRSKRLRHLQVRLLRRYHKSFLDAVAEAGLRTTDGAIGVAATGLMDEQALLSLIRAMPEGTWELVCHPGVDDEALAAAGTRLRASRSVERRALAAPMVREALQRAGVELIGFAGL